MSKYIPFTTEQKERAASVDLEEFLRRRGEKLITSGRDKRLASDHSITIRGCCIGAGRPKVILPIVARTEDDILREARWLSALKADCIEWRADWFSDALDAAAAVFLCLSLVLCFPQSETVTVN